jgi:drug/metabolite transporter (DMT)-like permease
MIWAYISVCLIYGTTFWAIRAGDEAGMPPFLFASVRFAVAGMIILLAVYFHGTNSFPRSSKVYAKLALIGVFNTTSVFAVVYLVEQYIPSCYTALMASTMPIVTLILGNIRHNEGLTRIQYVGLVCGFIGMFIVAWTGITQDIPHWILSSIALIVVHVLAAIGVMQSRSLSASRISPSVISGFQALFGSIGLFLLAAVTKGLSLQHVSSWHAGLWALLYLTFFGSVIASTLYFWLVKVIGPTIASTWTYVSPIVAIIVGHFWDHEQITTWTVVGTAVILSGILMSNLQSLRVAFRQKLVATQKSKNTLGSQ